MDLIVIVDVLCDDVSKEVLKWIVPLRAEKTGSVPIFSAQSEIDIDLLINLYKPSNLILCSSYLAAELYAPCLIKDLQYTIRIEDWMGTESKILILPSLTNLDWERTESALDRFEEIL